MIEKDKIVDTIVGLECMAEEIEQIGGGGSDDSAVFRSD